MSEKMQIRDIRALNDTVLVFNMNFGQRKLSSGIVLPTDDARDSGIRPRWAQVCAIGPDQKDVVVGQWILIEHGRWSRGLDIEINHQKITLRKVDNNNILLVSDDAPADDIISSIG